jgi:hypothetical protein
MKFSNLPILRRKQQTRVRMRRPLTFLLALEPILVYIARQHRKAKSPTAATGKQKTVPPCRVSKTMES